MRKIRYIIIFIILMICVYYVAYYNNNVSEYMINNSPSTKELKWYHNNNCIYNVDETTKNMLNKLNIENTTDINEADIIIPCSYNYINDEIEKMIPTGKVKKLFIIDGADEISAKNYLWTNIKNYHGINKAKTLSPNTYILTEPEKNKEIARLLEDHNKEKLYILKKNIQRQSGLEITDDIDKIKENKDDYVIVQELLQDSYLVNNRKINLRVYILVVCHKNLTNVYVYNNGFMYYTKNEFIKNNKDMDNHITTGYVDRDIYYKNPLTHTDFKRYLDMSIGERYHPSNDPRYLNNIEEKIRKFGFMDNDISNIVFSRIYNLLKNVFISFKGRICNNTKINDDYSFQLFGADVAINNKLQPQIIEINKGPDLSPKDDRDGSVKNKLMEDLAEILHIKKISDSNGFILILEF